MHNPYLVGKRVYLRALERTDLAGPMFQWANDPTITHFTLMGWVPNTMEALEREFDELQLPGNLTQRYRLLDDIIFAIIDKKADEHIGNVGLFDINWLFRTAELRAVIGDMEFWGGNRTTEAYRLVLGYAFNRLNLRRITAGIRADHVGSAIALKKVGFKCEGRLRQVYERDGQYYDVLPFGLLREDYCGKS